MIGEQGGSTSDSIGRGIRIAWGVGLIWWAAAAAQTAEGYESSQTAREAELRCQQALVKAKEERAAAEENLREALRLNGVLGRQLEQRYAQMAALQRQFHDLERSQGTSTARLTWLEQVLAAKQQAVDEAGKHPAEAHEARAALQERVKALEDAKSRLNDTLRDLQAAKAERDQLKAALSDRDNRLSRQTGSSGPSKATVYRVNDDYAFVVLSVKGIEWVQKGMAIALADGARVVATAQVTELDGTGFAVAEITHQADPFTPIHQGDIFLVTPLLPSELP